MKIERIDNLLKDKKNVWLVTGCAGFIGSNLTEYLLLNDQKVIGLDNFITGKKENIEDIKKCVGPKWENFSFLEGDITHLDTCIKACEGVDYILHQAALGSVPRSIDDPLNSHNNNVNGQLNILLAAKDARVKKVVYASSSSVYGDNPTLPKVEHGIGEQLSPYAVTTHVNELYGKVFYKTYGLKTIGIRYFNVFGKRQDPNSVYAAVMPKWIRALMNKEEVSIFGDGKTSRDFCYIKNVIQLNILAALSDNDEACGKIFNCACSDRTDLTTLFTYIRDGLGNMRADIKDAQANYKDFRPGDIRHSHANIDRATNLLDYKPTHMIKDGLKESLDWYYNNL